MLGAIFAVALQYDYLPSFKLTQSFWHSYSLLLKEI